jgi:DNA repair ATPase RecN
VAIMPIDVPSVERLIHEHESSKTAMLDLYQFTSSEFDQIVARIKQQESPPSAIRDEEKMYAVLGTKQQDWEQSWQQRKEQLEHHLQRCQFDADLQQLNAQLGELSAQLSRVRGQLGESLASAKANTQAFVAFEKTIEVYMQIYVQKPNYKESKYNKCRIF